MNATWHCRNCTGIMDKDRNFQKENKLFVSIANVIHENRNSVPKIWNSLKHQKAIYWFDQTQKHEKIFQYLLDDLHLDTFDVATYGDEITDETLSTAAKIILYLTSPPQKFWKDILHLYSSKWMDNKTNLSNIFAKVVILPLMFQSM